MRLMAIDGVSFAIPDTPANDRAFGRPTTVRNGQRVDGAYPQIQAVVLTELGTHLIREAFLKPCRHSEYRAARPLLKKVPPGSLVLIDRCFFGYEWLKDAAERNLEVLNRVGSHVVFKPIACLPDGSYLTEIRPSRIARRRGAKPLIARVMEYTIDDPNRTGHGERHRLVTTLLDAKRYPAIELAVLYHQRWEIEIMTRSRPISYIRVVRPSSAASHPAVWCKSSTASYWRSTQSDSSCTRRPCPRTSTLVG